MKIMEKKEVLISESEPKKNEITDSINVINSLMHDYQIMEGNWLAPEAYWAKGLAEREKLEVSKRNKLRKNWFNAILSEIQYSLNKILPPSDEVNELMEKTLNLIQMVKGAERTSKEQVNEAEAIAQKVLLDL